jgi:hypothetical protein
MFYENLIDPEYQALLEELEGQKAQRAEFIKNKLGDKLKPALRGMSIDEFVEKLGEVDPSLNGMYMPWMAKLVAADPNNNRIEDLDRVGQDLAAFEQHKRRIANKDINSYKSFNDLYDVIAPLLTPAAKSPEDVEKEKERAKLEKMKADIITVYNGPEGWIRIPTTEETASFLGQGTRWCTAATRGNNMFNFYNNSDNLFVVYDKETKKRHQLHINSGQFAQEDDRNVGTDAVPQWARTPIVDYYKANNPQLSLKHIMNLSKWTDENLAAGTDHEDLINLMKQYGV